VHVPGLQLSGAAGRTILSPPRLIVGWLSDALRAMVDLDDFVKQIHERTGSTRRRFRLVVPAGGSTESCGFEHWEAVEGRLLRFVVTGPQWLGGRAGIGAKPSDASAPPRSAGRLGTPKADDESHAAATCT
jgi:hypothetical protein